MMKKPASPIENDTLGREGHCVSNVRAMSPLSPSYARVCETPRPSRPADGWPAQYIQELEATGRMTVSAAGAGVSLRSVQRRRREDSAFAREEREALACCRDRAISELTRRAIDGVEEVIVTGTGKNRRETRRRVYSDTLLLRLLEYQETGSFRQKQQVEHSGGIASLPTLAARKQRLIEARAAAAADEAASLGMPTAPAEL
jgi:hypothetical protein